MPNDLYDQAYRSRWFESFVMFCEGLGPKAKVSGHDMDRFWLLSAGARLRSLARPDGELTGPHGTPYSVEQLTGRLRRSDKTVRRTLDYLETTGWMLTTKQANPMKAEARRLVIPAGAVLAWRGWPSPRRPVITAPSSGNDPVQPLPHDSGNDRDQPLPHTPWVNPVYPVQGSPVTAAKAAETKRGSTVRGGDPERLGDASAFRDLRASLDAKRPRAARRVEDDPL